MERVERRWLAGAGLVFLGDYLFTAFTWLTWNRRPGLGQDAFLLNALDAQRGILTLGNDHPFYPLVLSLWASRAPAAFTWAKLFSLGWGVLTLAVLARVGTALFGRREALLAAVLLSVNWVFLSLSMSLRAEVLLPLFFLLSWYAAWRGFREDGRWFLAAGVFAGLATLTKGTGNLLALCWLVALAAASLRDRSLWRRAGWYAAGYVLTAGFLWWANHSVLGDATYNYSSRHAFWLDTWWEAGTRPLEDQTLAGFLARHGVAGLFTRELSGMVSFAPRWLATLAAAPSFPLFHLARWPLAAAAAWSLWRSRGKAVHSLRSLDGAAVYTAVLFGAFFLLFSWYDQVSPSERFVAPLSPIAYLLLAAAVVPAAEAAFAALEARWPGRRLAAAAVGLPILLTGIGLGIKAAVWGAANPFLGDRPEQCYEEAMAWVAGREGRVLYGPSADLSTWPLSRPEAALGLPEGGPPKDLAAWLEHGGARSAVVDWDMARQSYLAGYFDTLEGGGVKVLALPKGWRLSGRDRFHEPPHFVLLEAVPHK